MSDVSLQSLWFSSNWRPALELRIRNRLSSLQRRNPNAIPANFISGDSRTCYDRHYCRTVLSNHRIPNMDPRREGIGAISLCLIYSIPQAPMAKPWWSVLNHLYWARGESGATGVATKLTQGLHSDGTYGGTEAYTRGLADPDTGETFYLKAFINHTLNDTRLWGQCNDFADFLTCLMAAVGLPRKAQRTHSVVSANRTTQLPCGHQGELYVFTTDPIDAAPAGGMYSSTQWRYHQFCLEGNSSVWDASLRFSGSIYALGMARDTTYRDNLVTNYIFWDSICGYVTQTDPGFFWQPTPSSGFAPTVTANDLP